MAAAQRRGYAMERPLLNDKNEFPDDQVLAKHLGKAKSAWDALTAGVAAKFPEASLEWRYYNDGNAWLCKLTRKKKTVCWISVWDKSFRISFYFTAKSDKDIENLEISPDAKDSYCTKEPTGKLKPFTIEVRTQKALKDVFVLAKYKSGLK
ncbi:MAG: DUF3788 family protein [Gemmatimonadales bacterium]|nr:DUF3788 family protein [Gemmatimonadales bacterium]